MATVPEHSRPLMEAMSGGTTLEVGNYLFFHANTSLLCIGYPLSGRFNQKEYNTAVENAIQQTSPNICYAIAPMPAEGINAKVLETDRYYVLPARENVPAKLRNPVKKALASLVVRESGQFTPEHRRLWAEFLAGKSMNERVAALYARTPAAMATGNLKLLDAIDGDGHVVASLLLDYAAPNFVSYILGAHSRKYYVPHAMDALFAKMQVRAVEEGKKFIHLGLGVNEGILRFKRKWGAIPSQSFVMYQWEPRESALSSQNLARTVALAVLRAPTISARQALANEPEQRPFAMLWEVKKGDRVSWLGGTAHFFCHSFEDSFRKLFRDVENVIFEGPLDAEFMAKVDEAGRQAPEKALVEGLSEEQIRALERVVLGPTGAGARILGIEQRGNRIDVRHLLSSCRVWYAFFTLWTAFLERRGWHQSVDMEAWRIANEMGKHVVGMETLSEQLESLESLPRERALRFFADCRSWKGRARSNMKAYLAGDLEKMMGSSAEFPTRTEHIVGRRDQRFRERMRPWLEAGGAAVFVGSAHLVNLRQMLIEDGFSARQKPFGIWPKIHLKWRDFARPDGKVTWLL